MESAPSWFLQQAKDITSEPELSTKPPCTKRDSKRHKGQRAAAPYPLVPWGRSPPRKECLPLAVALRAAGLWAGLADASQTVTRSAPREQGGHSLPPWRALHGPTASLQGDGLDSWWSSGKVWPRLESRMLPTRAACEIGACSLQPEAHSHLGRTTACAWLVDVPNAGSTSGRRFTRGLRPYSYQSPATVSRNGHSCAQGRTGEGYGELSRGGGGGGAHR
jgi:hypothetical protein